MLQTQLPHTQHIAYTSTPTSTPPYATDSTPHIHDTMNTHATHATHTIHTHDAARAPAHADRHISGPSFFATAFAEESDDLLPDVLFDSHVVVSETSVVPNVESDAVDKQERYIADFKADTHCQEQYIADFEIPNREAVGVVSEAGASITGKGFGASEFATSECTGMIVRGLSDSLSKLDKPLTNSGFPHSHVAPTCSDEVIDFDFSSHVGQTAETVDITRDTSNLSTHCSIDRLVIDNNSSIRSTMGKTALAPGKGNGITRVTTEGGGQSGNGGTIWDFRFSICVQGGAPSC